MPSAASQALMPAEPIMMKSLRLLLAPSLAVAAMAAPAAADQPRSGALGFQEPATPVMEKIVGLHDHVFLVMCIVIVGLVLGLLIWCAIRYNHRANPTPATFHHNTMLEVLWTGIPVLILIGLAIPSFRLLAYEATIPKYDMTIKASGSQWYWDYEYPDNGDFTFTSKMLQRPEAEAAGKPFKLGVDNPVYVPVNATVRMIVTGTDVIHSWAVPAFGVKMDAVPGRDNVTWFRAIKEGIYYGQCSELCGAFHAFMPIEVHVVSKPEFDAWAAKMKQQFGADADPPARLHVAENR
jgi:cytochrome c oxidase subunit II